MNIENALNEGKKILKKGDIKSLNLDSEILLSKVIGKDRKFDVTITKNKDGNIEKIIKKIKPDVLFEVIGQSDGISKKLVENALKKHI